MPKSFFINRTPPLPPPYCAIALILRAINLSFSRHPKPRCHPPGSLLENFFTVNGLNTLPNIVTETLTIRHNQHGYLGSHARQRRYLFYIYKSYYQFPKSSLLSTPHAPHAVLKQSLYTRKKFLVLTPLIN